jgi:hypothetical protein
MISYRTRVCPLGRLATPWRPVSFSSDKKCIFFILECWNWFFYEAATERVSQQLSTTSYINNGPPEMHWLALILTHKTLGVSSVFCAGSCQFCWKRGGTVCTLAHCKTGPWFFAKKHFWAHNTLFLHKTSTVQVGPCTTWLQVGVFGCLHFMRVLNRL